MAETLLLWAVVIAAAVLVVRYLVTLIGSHTPAMTAPRPDGLLAERYARGEIDDAEYQRRIALLKEHQ
ncbi:SHOCT domain-containing protein [Mycobacterium sp.]|uniref:SHOCT domain-containing protein n=1 Tax=Mycobacterium sp. TaxID=1785 RepID=UPI0025EF0791|nr:SHOCT domain-containing protein [Mycobacterium sp.]